MKVKELFETIYNFGVKINQDGVINGSIKHDYLNDIVIGDFDCLELGLTTLKNCPKSIEGGFYCYDNDLSSLEFCPDYVSGHFSFFENPKITSLEGIGTKYCFKIGRRIEIPNTITSNILGILKIKELTDIHTNPVTGSFGSIEGDLLEAAEIINKHLQGARRINKCREELIEAGLKEYAKL
jgi:hypothetical protein